MNKRTQRKFSMELSIKTLSIATYSAAFLALLLTYLPLIIGVFSKAMSRESLRFSNYCLLACSEMFKNFRERDEREENKLSEWSKKFNDKKRKWARKSEKLPQQVQRAQREALRERTYIPFLPFGINLEVTGRVIRVWLCLCFTCILPFIGIVGHWCNPYVWAGVLTVLAFALLQLTITKLPLRNSKWWWYRPWPLSCHAYRRGHFPFKEYHYFLFLYLGLPLSICLLLWMGQFIWWKLRQPFAAYYVYHVSKRYHLVCWALVASKSAPYSWIFSQTFSIGELVISTAYKQIKKVLYAVWVFLTPFLNERRRKGLRVYWTFV